MIYPILLFQWEMGQVNSARLFNNAENDEFGVKKDAFALQALGSVAFWWFV